MSDLLARLARFARWHRRTIGACAAVICFLATVWVLSPTSEGIGVIITTRDLPLGATLSADDLAVVKVPTTVVPQGALSDAQSIIGRTLTGPVTRGTMLTEVSTTSLREISDNGRALVPFRVKDASLVALLEVGRHIKVVGSATDGSVINVADDVEIVNLPPPQDTGIGSSNGALIVVAADNETAARLAAAAGQMDLGVIMS